MAASTQRRIMVVDDDTDSLEITMQAIRLGDRTADVICVGSGQECMARLQSIRPHLIVMDLALPHMDGWQTLASIRANPSLAGIPVVAITAYHSFNVAEDARRAGFDAYFPKPLNVARFMSNLEHILIGHS